MKKILSFHFLFCCSIFCYSQSHFGYVSGGLVAHEIHYDAGIGMEVGYMFNNNLGRLKFSAGLDLTNDLTSFTSDNWIYTPQVLTELFLRTVRTKFKSKKENQSKQLDLYIKGGHLYIPWTTRFPDRFYSGYHSNWIYGFELNLSQHISDTPKSELALTAAIRELDLIFFRLEFRYFFGPNK